MADGILGRLRAGVADGLRARRTKRGRHGRSVPAGGTVAGPPEPGGGIVVSYRPERDGEPDPGEVVWAWVPYEEDPTQGKDRPVLVLGHDGPMLAAVQLSSRDRTGLHDGSDWVPVGTGAWDSQGRPSYADASRLLRLRPDGVRREGAALHRDRFDDVVARVAAIHGWRDHR